MDGESASASEVPAGALQDHRAAVVGEPTYGKGMLQTTRSFPEYGTRAKVTSAYFYSPSKRNFERRPSPAATTASSPTCCGGRPRDAPRGEVLAGRYDPPASAMAALASGRRTAGRSSSSLATPQLDAAVGLFRGEALWPAASA